MSPHFKGLDNRAARGQFASTFVPHRFSAFWLRSKCSICSYQLNIWYEGHCPSSILNWFLKGDGVLELAPALSRVGPVLQYRRDRHTTPLIPHISFCPGLATRSSLVESYKDNFLNRFALYWVNTICNLNLISIRMALWQNHHGKFHVLCNCTFLFVSFLWKCHPLFCS